MELAKKGWIAALTDFRTIILREQELEAYDISLIHYNFTILTAPGDNIDEFTLALSRRLEDQVEASSTVEVSLTDMRESPGIFGLVSYSSGITVEGGFLTVMSHTIPFPKPYRVPFAAMILNAASSVTQQGSVEIYFDKVRVQPDEMAWLRRRTEVIRTT